MKLNFVKEDKYIFEAIKKGYKNVETRATTIKYKTIKAGDILIFVCEKETFRRQVKRVRLFLSIEEMLTSYQPNEINPLLRTHDEIITMCYSLPGYKEKIEASGILAFELVLLEGRYGVDIRY